MLAEDPPQPQPQPQPAAALRRERGALAAAGLTGGPAELIDFLLPLWAGIALGASATEVGLLVALEMAVSLVARPIAGVLADTRERRTVASAGALLYALSCAGYATAGSIGHAYAAAALGGVGGAFLWVALRAIVSERLHEDTAVYPRLMSATETGTWVAFVCGFTLLDLIDFEGLFLGCALACLVAAVWLLASPPREPALAGAGAGAAGVGAAGVGVAGVGVAGVGVGVAGAGAAGVGAADRGAAGADAAGADAAGVATAGGRGGALGAVGRRLRPMLLAVAFTMAAEAAVGLLLLLHLQRGFELAVVEIAFVFLPGAIAMSLLPERIHRLVCASAGRACWRPGRSPAAASR